MFKIAEGELKISIPTNVFAKTYKLNGKKVINGWAESNDKWYYIVNGKAISGWKNIGEKWYYFNGENIMISNDWVGEYYCDEDGSMVSDCIRTIDGKDYYFDVNGKNVKDFIEKNLINNWINEFMTLYDGAMNTEIKCIEYYNLDNDNIKFSYIFGSNENTFINLGGFGTLWIDYVVGIINDGKFIRNQNLKYDNDDVANIYNIKENWRNLLFDKSKYNLKTTIEEYKNGKREDCNIGLWLTSNPIYIKNHFSDSELRIINNYISNDFPLTTSYMTEEHLNNIMELSNLYNKYLR